MRRPIVLYLALAALVASVASVALADKPETATADLQQRLTSGISGTAEFKLMPDGSVRVHEVLTGLTPGETYQSVIDLSASDCGAGLTAIDVGEPITANKSGKAVINETVAPVAAPLIVGGAFISVRQGSDIVACGQIL